MKIYVILINISQDAYEVVNNNSTHSENHKGLFLCILAFNNLFQKYPLELSFLVENFRIYSLRVTLYHIKKSNNYDNFIGIFWLKLKKN